MPQSGSRSTYIAPGSDVMAKRPVGWETKHWDQCSWWPGRHDQVQLGWVSGRQIYSVNTERPSTNLFGYFWSNIQMVELLQQFYLKLQY